MKNINALISTFPVDLVSCVAFESGSSDCCLSNFSAIILKYFQN